MSHNKKILSLTYRTLANLLTSHPNLLEKTRTSIFNTLEDLDNEISRADEAAIESSLAESHRFVTVSFFCADEDWSIDEETTKPEIMR